MARVTGTAKFFEVTRENLDELKQTKSGRVFGCFIREDDGWCRYSEQYTKTYKAWQEAPGRTVRVESAQAIFGIDDDGARVVAHAYFENEGDLLEIHHMWLIDRAAIVE
ncbi:hypothetical protein BCY88_35410 [Paraburkholderia fungorum]|uniref:Uncharacterized protein n=1 Tax=Paraburkholderia fungorum TaxID=134537 RepID=A0A3R7I6Z3_9BURK|nr:hypothetical protein BCY88_35410 [Paraburkholderia fungorum]